MTTKRKAQGATKGKGKPERPRELYDERGVQRNPFDSDIEAREAIEMLCSHLFATKRR